MLKPAPYKRGDSLENFEGKIVGGIGGFSQACVHQTELKEPLEVVLLQGSRAEGFHARLGDAHHKLYEGKLQSATVSFTLEAFSTEKEGDPLTNISKDSSTLKGKVTGELRNYLINRMEKEKIKGALFYIKGIAKDIKTYGHTDPHRLNDRTKTFDQTVGQTTVEGWGNFSLIDGKTPFVHIHGTYAVNGVKKGGHFIMDDKTPFLFEKGEIFIHPVAPIIRAVQTEDFPTWRVGK
ncbi:MAG: hypothetical protein Q7S68_03235 [Deltaproteobacteria bacterium]|nr:hypothetical protein [Deltaproteobacteria bacterium]